MTIIELIEMYQYMMREGKTLKEAVDALTAAGVHKEVIKAIAAGVDRQGNLIRVVFEDKDAS